MRTKRFLLNFSTGFLSSLVVTAVGLVAAPWLLRWLGEERFGAYRVALDWLGYVGLLELGLSGALLSLLAKAAVEQETRENALAETMSAGLRAYALVLVPMAFVVALLVWFAPFLTHISPTLAHDLRIGCAIGGINILFFLFGPFRMLADATQRGYKINFLSMCQNVLTTAFSLYFAWRGAGISGQFIAIVAAALPIHLALVRDGIIQYPFLFRKIVKSPKQTQAWSNLWKLNLPNLIWAICGRVSLLTDSIVVALILGPAVVVPLVFTQRTITFAQAQLQNVGNASWAALAELHAHGERERFNLRLLELTKLVAMASVVALVPLAICNSAFISLWIGKSRYGGPVLTVAAAVSAYLQALFSLWGWCFTATGQVGRMVPRLVITTVVNLVSSIALTLIFGLPGPVLGSVVALITVDAWWGPVLLREVFGVRLRDLSRSAFFPLLLAPPLAGLCYLFTSLFDFSGFFGWIKLGASLSIEFSICAMGMYLLVLSPGERASWRARLARLRGVSA